MIKKRTRPTARVREPSPLADEQSTIDDKEEVEPEAEQLAVADLLELRRLKRSRQGIDSAKLTQGDGKKRRRRPKEGEEDYEVDEGGLRKGAAVDKPDSDAEIDEDDKAAKARKSVRSNNFTQQTNTLDVDKHMMAYIEENMRKQKGESDSDPGKVEPADPYAELHRLADRYKVQKKRTEEEGSVTNSLAMLTAIPEVDLGMDARLKNIEDTEKAKRQVAEERKDRRPRTEEEPIAGSRFYRPNIKMKTDEEIMRDAKLEAMGMPIPDEPHQRSYGDRQQTATDEMVMERFKKRMKR